MEESIKVTVRGKIDNVQANVGTNLSPYAKKEWVESLIRDIGKEVFFFGSESEMEAAERNREWLYVVGTSIYRWTGLTFRQIGGGGSAAQILEMIRDDVHVGDFAPAGDSNIWIDTSKEMDADPDPIMEGRLAQAPISGETLIPEIIDAEQGKFIDCEPIGDVIDAEYI